MYWRKVEVVTTGAGKSGPFMAKLKEGSKYKSDSCYSNS